MGNKNNSGVNYNGDNGDNSSHSIIVAKGDGFILAYVIMFCFFITVSLVGAYHIGVLTEKVGQLEDVVFIFGIAIDGTLIFRKRNYPDVSNWEDPKIIIHSNN